MQLSEKHQEQLIDMLALARSRLSRCPSAVHLIENGFDGTHHADICIRADGQDYHCEGDWARHALHLLRRIASDNGVREIPNHAESGTFPLNPPRMP